MGGNYSLPESAPARDRHATPAALASTQTDAADPGPQTPTTAPSSVPSVAAGAALQAVSTTDSIHFEPLQVGSRIKADVTLSASAEMSGGPSAMAADLKSSIDGRLRVEIKVLKASAQSLDKIELTLTLLTMHTVFAGESTDSTPEPPETYEVTLSGPSPLVVASNGSKVDPEERIALALFVVPLAEFYARWARSPTLELKPGWTSQVPLPFATALFASEPNQSLRAGPLRARFGSRSPASDDVPFELTLPVKYSGALGKAEFELSGSATLNAKNARPMAFDLGGPLRASAGPPGSQMSVTGSVKLAATVSYP